MSRLDKRPNKSKVKFEVTFEVEGFEMKKDLKKVTESLKKYVGDLVKFKVPIKGGGIKIIHKKTILRKEVK